MFRKISFIMLMILSCLCWSQQGEAARTDCSVQMSVMDSDGVAVTSSVDYEIHFYPNATVTNGEAELATAVTGTATPDSGLLNVSFPCSASLLSATSVYLEFVIGGETLSPRTEMTSVPFAGTAFSLVGGSGAGLFPVTDSNGSTTLVTPSGDVSISGAGVFTIADGAVTSAKILDGTIATVDFSDASVTAAKIADSAVTSAKISDGTIASADLADSAVTSAKILDGTIAPADLADSSVTTAKISDGTITEADIAASLAGNGLTGGAGTALAVGDGTGIAIAADGISLATTEVGDTTWGSGANFTWTMNGGGTAPQFMFSSGTTVLTNSTLFITNCGGTFQSAGRYCIETDERVATDWVAAAQNCQTANARLCSPSEWMGACGRVAGLNNMTDNVEYVDSLADNANAISMAGCNAANIGVTAVAAGAAYRCCYSK